MMGARTRRGNTANVNLILSSILSMIKAIQNGGISIPLTASSSKMLLDSIDLLNNTKQTSENDTNKESSQLNAEVNNDDEDGI